MREPLPADVRHRFLTMLRRMRRPARFGTLGRCRPLSNQWGVDRGLPIDRYYIEAFLELYREDIRGRVLEVKDSDYTVQFGTAVEIADVLDIDPSNARATITADLSAASTIADDQFDCLILTQTLHHILDTRSALEHAHRILRPGGVVLATLPAVSRIVRGHGYTTDYWRFTPASCLALFERSFGPGQVRVHSYGNVTSAIAFLAGAAREDLGSTQLDTRDEYFPVILGVCARKRCGDRPSGVPE